MSEVDSSAGSAASTDVAGLISGGQAAGHWVLDPARSSVEFAVKHFWGAITVRGSFGTISGEGTVGQDGAVSGWLNLDAASLSTRNKQRDQHLRSADFFDVEHHRMAVITVTDAKPTGQDALACSGTLEAAGHAEPIEFTAQVEVPGQDAVVLRAEIEVDRTKFAMTWSPMRVAAFTARGTVVARFVRS